MTTNVSVTTNKVKLPVTAPVVGGVTLDNSIVRSLRVDKELNLHDSASITLLMPMLDAQSLVGKSITFRYGTSPNYGYFYGYVDSVSKPQPFQEQVQITISCVGFSRKMRIYNSKMFQSISSVSLVNEIVKPYKFAVRMDPHWFTHKRFSLVGLSDWEATVKIARMTKRFIVPFNGYLWFVDPITELSNRVSSHRFQKSTQIMDPSRWGLMDFNPVAFVTNDPDDLLPKFSYFDDKGSVRSYSPSDPIKTNTIIRSDFYIYNSEFADLLKDTITQRNIFTQGAEARVRGDASLSTGLVVDMVTGLPTTYGAKDTYDGLWFVSKLTHQIDESLFQTNLGLIRDKYRSVVQEPYEWFYKKSGGGLPSMSVDSQDTWISNAAR
jgi:hypothetical protein